MSNPANFLDIQGLHPQCSYVILFGTKSYGNNLEVSKYFKGWSGLHMVLSHQVRGRTTLFDLIGDLWRYLSFEITRKSPASGHVFQGDCQAQIRSSFPISMSSFKKLLRKEKRTDSPEPPFQIFIYGTFVKLSERLAGLWQVEVSSSYKMLWIQEQNFFLTAKWKTERQMVF